MLLEKANAFYTNSYIQIFLFLVFIFFILDIVGFMLRKYGRYVYKLQYIYYYLKVKRLENKINNNYFNTFNKTKKVVLWIMILRKKGIEINTCLDIAFLKVYDITGTDELTQNEKESF